MVQGAERFFEVSGAVFSNRQQTPRKSAATLAANAMQALTDRFCDRCRHTLSSSLSQLLGEFVRFFVLNIQAHVLPVYYYILPCYLVLGALPSASGAILSWSLK